MLPQNGFVHDGDLLRLQQGVKGLPDQQLVTELGVELSL